MILIFTIASFFSLSAQQVQEISVIANNSVAEVQPTMWGVFFEDINFAADGGIYAELVKNRSFEFTLPLMGWRLIRQNGEGRVFPTFYTPASSANPHYVNIVVDAGSGSFGLVNEGFRGMGIKQNNQYNFSVFARISRGSDLKMKVELLDTKGVVIEGGDLEGFSTSWEKYRVSFKSARTEPKATLRILGAEPLPILNCGMSCQFNAAEVVPLNELNPYIQDSVTNPKLIYPSSKPVTISAKKLNINLDPRSANVIILDYKKPK